MMEHPEPFLRDIPRVAVHLSKEEHRNLEGCLSGVNPGGWMLRMATQIVPRPDTMIEEVREQISPGWNEFTNEELGVVTCFTHQIGAEFHARLCAARRQIERTDAANVSPSYRGASWDDARDQARREAGNACNNCGSGENLHVHHEIPYRRFNTSEHANQQDNLSVLCGSCHSKKSHK